MMFDSTGAISYRQLDGTAVSLNQSFGIYQFNTEMIYRARLDILFAACVIVALPALILFTVFNKTITSNVSLGGIKG